MDDQVNELFLLGGMVICLIVLGGLLGMLLWTFRK